MNLDMCLIFDYHKYLKILFIDSLLNKMLILKTVIPCTALQGRVSFWFISALIINFPSKHLFNPKMAEKITDGKLVQKETVVIFFQLVSWNL